nr:hypothetical protein [uncultured Deefgea sp.]
MSDLLNTPATRDWADNAILRLSKGPFGKLVPSIIWTDARTENGELIVPADPAALSAKINNNPFILLHNHDPGYPKGQVLESANFETESGERFVAAILGFYEYGEVLDFVGLGIDTQSLVQPPETLPILPDTTYIQFATDPREVDSQWMVEITNSSPIRIEHVELSHNAAESAQELIRVGLIYLAIVWNPFITAIASEAGKGTYAAIHNWIRLLLTKMADRRNPVLDIQSHQNGCQVSFLLRGKDVK